MSVLRRVLRVALLAVLAVLLAACGGTGATTDAGHDMSDGEAMGDHNGVDHAGQGSVDEPVEGAPEITLNAVDIDFQPETIELTAGKSVNVTVVNAGQALHDFTLEEAGVHVNVPPGGQVTTSLVVDEPGAYEALCTVPGHAAAGMVVKVVVGK
jgi:uncharacterized cupredoxin-like copper-binding protein